MSVTCKDIAFKTILIKTRCLYYNLSQVTDTLSSFLNSDKEATGYNCLGYFYPQIYEHGLCIAHFTLLERG